MSQLLFFATGPNGRFGFVGFAQSLFVPDVKTALRKMLIRTSAEAKQAWEDFFF